ncbi:MAG: SDR family NAD(P)-dependent oxidoreductase [Rectinemataceae bacterium]
MLKNKVAVVTGAGQGLGKAIAESLAEKGSSVAIVDIKLPEARSVAEEITRSGGKAIAVGADVSKVEDIRRMVRETVAAFSGIDILVNNAGILHQTAIEDITEEEWDRMMAVNLKSVFFSMQQVLPSMKSRGSGRIISISSLAGRMGGYANGVAYSASKAGIIGLTRAVARRLASFGITVNAIAPGTTETDIIKSLSVEQIDMLKEAIPLKRLGRPDNVSELVAFLCTDAADFITGAVIDVNGGIYMA